MTSALSIPHAALVLPECPFPPTCGNALRDVQQIALLQRLGYSVVLVCVRHRHGSSVSIDRNNATRLGLEIEFISERAYDHTESWPVQVWRKVEYLRPDNTSNPFAWWCNAYHLPVTLPARLAAIAPCAIVLRSLFVDLLPFVRDCRDGAVVVDCHDADVHLAREMVRTVPWWRTAGPWANYCGVRTVCRRFLPLADEIWTVSAEDAERIRPFAGSRPVLVVPSAIDEHKIVPAADPGCDDACAMVANFGYGPNLNAAGWLVERVWRRVRQTRPAARLLLVGGGGEDELRDLAARGPGITATGLVEDLRPIYAEAGVMLAPLHQGGGSRLKIVEAWRHGKAVLATSKGLEGTAAPPGVAAVHDRPEQFADALVGLMTNSSERRRLGEAGRRFVGEHLSFSRVEEALRTHSLLSRQCLTPVAKSGGPR